jgi:hypothetical protein
VHLSLAQKIIAVIKDVCSIAPLLAGAALIACDTSTACTSLTRDIGVLAEVVGNTSTAAVSFNDAKAASAVAVNKNARIAAILRGGSRRSLSGQRTIMCARTPGNRAGNQHRSGAGPAAWVHLAAESERLPMTLRAAATPVRGAGR